MRKSWPGFVTGIMAVIFSAAAWADGGIDSSADDLSRLIGASSGFSASTPLPIGGQNEPLRLTSNKNELVRLSKDAASVIVNNPEHVNVMLDSPRLLIIMPRLPGATSFIVLDNRGEIIMEKDVIVSNVKAQYVRVRKACVGEVCAPAAYYYCPDGCYEVTPVTPGESGAETPPPAGGNASGSLDGGAAANINEQSEEEEEGR